MTRLRRYDVVALIAAVPELRARHFQPLAVGESRNLIIGLNSETSNVRDGPALSRVMVRGILDGIRPTAPARAEA